MNKTLLGKSLLIIVLALAAVVVLLRRRLILGLDLKPGTGLILHVKVEWASSGY